MNTGNLDPITAPAPNLRPPQPRLPAVSPRDLPGTAHSVHQLRSLTDRHPIAPATPRVTTPRQQAHTRIQHNQRNQSTINHHAPTHPRQPHHPQTHLTDHGSADATPRTPPRTRARHNRAHRTWRKMGFFCPFDFPLAGLALRAKPALPPVPAARSPPRCSPTPARSPCTPPDPGQHPFRLRSRNFAPHPPHAIHSTHPFSTPQQLVCPGWSSG